MKRTVFLHEGVQGRALTIGGRRKGRKRRPRGTHRAVAARGRAQEIESPRRGGGSPRGTSAPRANAATRSVPIAAFAEGDEPRRGRNGNRVACARARTPAAALHRHSLFRLLGLERIVKWLVAEPGRSPIRGSTGQDIAGRGRVHAVGALHGNSESEGMFRICPEGSARSVHSRCHFFAGRTRGRGRRRESGTARPVPMRDMSTRRCAWRLRQDDAACASSAYSQALGRLGGSRSSVPRTVADEWRRSKACHAPLDARRNSPRPDRKSVV